MTINRSPNNKTNTHKEHDTRKKDTMSSVHNNSNSSREDTLISQKDELNHEEDMAPPNRQRHTSRYANNNNNPSKFWPSLLCLPCCFCCLIDVNFEWPIWIDCDD
jgi:hypothetical protein